MLVAIDPGMTLNSTNTVSAAVEHGRQRLQQAADAEQQHAGPRTSPLVSGEVTASLGGELSSTQTYSGYWCVSSVAFACSPWIQG